MAIEIVGCVTKSSSEALVMLRVRHAVQKYFNWLSVIARFLLLNATKISAFYTYILA